jgi:hypothetical protein
MIIPTSFAQDNFDSYPDGALPAPSGGVVWTMNGFATNLYPTIPQDNFDSYPDGALPNPAGGLNWLTAGTSTHYANA